MTQAGHSVHDNVLQSEHMHTSFSVFGTVSSQWNRSTSTQLNMLGADIILAAHAS